MNNPLKKYFLLDPEIIFLNHGSFGACPRPVFRAYQNWQRILEREPVQFLGRDFPAHDRQARQTLAAYLHTAANNLVFVPNATHGVNIVARSLPLAPGDEILTSDHEYGACDYTWEFICQKTGTRYLRQPIPLPAPPAEEIVERIWQAVNPRTRLIYLSQVTSPTALRLPVEAICARARQAGILALVDGAHAPGQIPLYLDTLGADFYTGNCHKWMLSPKGAGFLYTHPRVQGLVEPLIVSWGYHASPETTAGSQFLDYLIWNGTKDPAAALAVSDAIDFMHAHGWEQVSQNCHALLIKALQRIDELTGQPSIYPHPAQGSDLLPTQIGAAQLPRLRDPARLKARLFTEDQIEIPIIEWGGRHLIRLSIQGYNTPQDIDALLRALARLLPEETA
ncbi:MAG: aminotransferase class V-fold PLP-dependent enzyme [Anaerolineales bacterium]|nr:aminotransferase class V-fold PLP-dependent enzyme [Anaerolineales bacterium]